jgi:phage N-6-adenine-methyltransferase
MAKSTDERETPQDFWEKQNQKWNFKLDAAALSSNAKCENYLGPDHPIGAYRDGLEASWECGGTVWCNPPYSRGEIVKWLAKAQREADVNGITTVMLLPVDTSTKWFHVYVLPLVAKGDVEFVYGRLSFKGTPLTKLGKQAKAKQASMLVVFRGKNAETGSN